MLKNQITLTAILTATTLALLTTCGRDDDIDIRVSISEIKNTTTNSANVTVRYTAENVNVTQIGVLYGATPGRLNVATIVNNPNREPDADFGFLTAPPSVSGRIDFDLTNLGDGTDYFVAPFIKLDKATSEFPHGYFLPAGHKTFKTEFAPGQQPPRVSACGVKEISYTTAVFEATILTNGNPVYAKKGFCYGTSPDPMLEDGKSECVPSYSPGPLFEEAIAGLSGGNTAYYARAYISNNRHPVQYGETREFRTAGGDGLTMTDARDGQTYRLTEIGRFTWMAENLNYKPASGSWCYGDDEANCGKYGRLYTQAAARSACPAGWHLPTLLEWSNLAEAAGGAASAGRMLKSAEWDGTDNYGFSALPGGYRDSPHVRVYLEIGNTGRWWTAASNGTYRTMSSGSGSVGESSGGGDGYSVRCMKDW